MIKYNSKTICALILFAGVILMFFVNSCQSAEVSQVAPDMGSRDSITVFATSYIQTEGQKKTDFDTVVNVGEDFVAIGEMSFEGVWEDQTWYDQDGSTVKVLRTISGTEIEVHADRVFVFWFDGTLWSYTN
jgi:hypothetical protein